MAEATGGGETSGAGDWTRLFLIVVAPFSAGYFLSQLYRSVNAVLAPRLVAELGLSAADLGLLTSAYFLAFAAGQIPLGLLLDRFGPRRIQACLFVVAAAGALVFSVGESKWVLTLGRALIGLGVAGGLMAAFKAVVLWFPEGRWPFVNGCIMTVGGLGALTATRPVEMLLGLTDWRGVFFGLGVISLAVAAVIFLVAPDKRAPAAVGTLGDQLRGLGRVYRDRLFWRLAPLITVATGAAFSIMTLWAGPWLRDLAGFDQTGVANHLFLMMAAMTVGFFGTGLIGEAFNRFRLPLILALGISLGALILAQAGIVFEIDRDGVLLWLALGFFSNVAILGYALIAGHFPLALSGRATTAMNVLTFGGAFVAQYVSGAIIDLWPLAADGGYRPEAYRAAFGFFLALQALAFLWFLVPHDRQTRREE